MPAEYPPLEGPEPQIWTADHVRAAEEALRQLAVADAILKKCERCKIPVNELRADCDGMCQFFTHWLEEYRGQQASLPLAIT